MRTRTAIQKVGESSPIGRSRVAGVLAALVVTTVLTACSPSAEQLQCEREGGTWTSYVGGYTYIYVNKVLVPQPIILFRCDPNQQNGRRTDEHHE